jgi:beta-phosphoglucomutase
MGDFHAVIFDLDGVLVRTDELNYQAWSQLCARHGYVFSRAINEHCRGISRLASLEVILRANGLSLSPEEKAALCAEKNVYYLSLVKTLTPAAVAPDTRKTLKELKDRGARLAVASSSKNAPITLRQIGLLEAFDAVVDGNEIQKAKPDPEIFLLAGRKLGVSPAQALVVEDATAGIDAANAGGFYSVGISYAAAYLSARSRIAVLSELIPLWSNLQKI